MKNNPVVEQLHQLQADATVFQQKMRHFHWNVKGHDFFTLHEKFEELYTRWQTLIDDLAERVLQLGGVPTGTLAANLEKSKVKETSDIPDAIGMVKQTLADLRSQLGAFKQAIAAAEKADDRTTANMLDDIADETGKTIWMLEAFSAQ
jgi:starvation-inducible DNA-binding protein